MKELNINLNKNDNLMKGDYLILNADIIELNY
ncbi:putative membrane-anchored protein [Pedobacter sp. AK017]|nr:putative membrane-anchored protein [Pedobacter sp. AK017]